MNTTTTKKGKAVFQLPGSATAREYWLEWDRDWLTVIDEESRADFFDLKKGQALFKSGEGVCDGWEQAEWEAVFRLIRAKPLGRKPLPAERKRVRLNTIVAPETLAKIRELSEAGNLSLGQLVDRWAARS
jgi:hypothetical protein